MGIVTGVLWIGAVVAVLMLSGVIKVTNINTISMLWLWIISVFINTVMQELLVRGYLYQMIKSSYNIIAATIVTTLLFTFMHGGAFEAGVIPVLNVISMSVLMTVVLEYTHSLLMPIIMHFIWNCIGAIILGGVSLAEDYPHLLDIEFTGNILITGGVPKIEGSIVVLLVNVILSVVFLILLKKKNHSRWEK